MSSFKILYSKGEMFLHEEAFIKVFFIVLSSSFFRIFRSESRGGVGFSPGGVQL